MRNPFSAGADVAPRPQFKSLEEEVAYLRTQVEAREHELETQGVSAEREQSIRREIERYGSQPPETALHPEFALPKEDQQKIVLELTPKGTDAQVTELMGLMQEKGVLNTLAVIEKIPNPMLEDDFHRFLVQYLKARFPVKGLKERSTLLRGLSLTLYEVSLPELSKEEEKQTRPLKELLSSMEQFYAGMMAVSEKGEDNWFALEIGVSNDRSDIVVYAAVPDAKKELFEKHFLSIFPNGKLLEQKDDYNIFDDESAVALSEACFAREAALPLKLYSDFDYDPLNVLLNSFYKIKEQGEGAAIQLLVGNPSTDYVSKYRHALEEIGKGVKLKRALDVRESLAGEFFKDLSEGFNDALFSSDKKKTAEEGRGIADVGEREKLAMEAIKKKIGSPILKAQLRLVASAADKPRADHLLADLESAFNQFEDTQGNKLLFERRKGSRLAEEVRDFSFRLFSATRALPMSLKELATIFHFPGAGKMATPELKHAKSNTGSAPSGFNRDGIVLGVNKHRSAETTVYMGREDRLRHFYCIGQTGTGKSTLLKNMIIQDIQNGDGVCMIDPHGTDIVDVLAAVPRERYEDVIYFDPSYTARPMGLNMMEFDPAYPEQKTFVVNELLSIFRKLFGAVPESMGPAFEQYFRNSALLVMEHPESGNTLIEIGRIMGDSDFRELKLSHCKNPIITQFWENAERTSGEQSLANFVPYITNKFDPFVSNEIMRPVIAQEKSAFNFRDIMDTKKIFLVNLSKGRLGDLNANLIGLVLVGKFLMAALSRVDSLDKDLPPFYLYIDEFQNITTDSIATILSEARKYKLSLTIAHQYIKQLEDKIRDAVFGNVGSLCAFRVGAEDAEFLEKTFNPVFTAKDIMNLDNRNAYLKLLMNGKPERPFNIETLAPVKGSKEVVGPLRELSYLKYGRDREEVDSEILARYNQDYSPRTYTDRA